MSASHAAIAQALSDVLRKDRGRMLSALIAHLGGFQLAEDCLQDALESAMTAWARSGVPERPQGWLLKVAKNRAIDRIRRDKVLARNAPDLAMLAEEAADMTQTHEIPDERLRLIFTCCHPALEPKTQVALTLRSLGGLTTGEIARAFLDKDSAMGQRLARAKAKIAAAGIAYEVPEGENFDARLQSVLTVIYLIFNEGYSASDQDSPVRLSLCEEALWLAGLLNTLRPEHPEIEGLLALLQITHARAAARMDKAGRAVMLRDQDVGLWDRAMLRKGLEVLDRAVARASAGPFQIKAAIGACHAKGRLEADTDWAQIVGLYEALYRFESTPVVRLNQVVALGKIEGAKRALDGLDLLKSQLETYQPFHAARAEFLARDGQMTEALAAYDTALALTHDQKDRAYLLERKSRIRPN